MKRLYILRHGKSSWSQPGQGDFDRPLNDRGIKQMSVLSRWWQEEGSAVEVILCSAAQRTQETLARLSSALESVAGQSIETDICNELYNGDLEAYQHLLWQQSADSVLIVGHNPTCDDLTRWLSAPSSPASDVLMASHFGTGTLAVLDLKIDKWSDIARGSGQLLHLLRPKALEARFG